VEGGIGDHRHCVALHPGEAAHDALREVGLDLEQASSIHPPPRETHSTEKKCQGKIIKLLFCFGAAARFKSI
jgi:hypothetical protein